MNSFIRSIGLFFIILFCSLSIFISFLTNDVNQEDVLQKIISFTNFFENQFYDLRMRQGFDLRFRDKNIALVSIDDSSLQKIGTWPIPRTYHAKLINKLSDFGAKVVAFDVMFPEKSLSCNQDDPDKILAQAIKDFESTNRKVFFSYTISYFKEEGLKEVPDSLYNYMMDSKIPSGAELGLKYISKHNFPIKEFTDAGVGLGHIAMRDDLDGIFRNYQMVANLDSFYLPSLGLAAYEAFIGKQTKLELNADNTALLKFNNHQMEINSQGETKIRFVGGYQQFDEISYIDVINADLSDTKMQKRIKDKIIFVGSTATGAHDLRPTPVDAKLPGVYIHMNINHMLINNFIYQPSAETIKYSLILLFLGSLLLLITQSFGIALLDIGLLVGLLGGSFALDSRYFMPQGYEIKLFYCWLCFVAVYSWNTFLNFQSTSKEKKQIRGAFSRYVAPTVVTEMLKDPDNIKLGGTKKNITCLFSDVRDFTSISEKLSADQLASALNYYMNAMTNLIFESKGTVDKYIGDAIVAIWGAPLEFNDHPQYAVECAIKMTNKMHEVNQELKRLYNLEFKVGVGLNSGECSVGNMGSDRIFSYTALGDNMNLGARLEGLCKYYGAQIIISEFTLARLNATIKSRPLDRVLVKGKNHPVAIFEVLHDQHPFTLKPDLLKKYTEAYQLFLKKNINEALILFKEILQTLPEDKPTLRLVSLCEQFLSTEIPETDHDVTKMTEK